MGRKLGQEETWTCGRCHAEHPTEQVDPAKCPECDWEGQERPFYPKHKQKFTINLDRDVV
jgi:hypothetical protein